MPVPVTGWHQRQHDGANKKVIALGRPIRRGDPDTSLPSAAFSFGLAGLRNCMSLGVAGSQQLPERVSLGTEIVSVLRHYASGTMRVSLILIVLYSVAFAVSRVPFWPVLALLC